jgi:peptide methionine sulfoxide reductase MsrB
VDGAHSAPVIRRLNEEKEMPTYRKDPDAIARLSREQHRVTQQAATELPGTGEHLYNKEPGIYVDNETTRGQIAP